jgi:hypothetical protein
MTDPTQVIQQQSLEYISKTGREFYLSELRDKLEKDAFNKYVVIEPTSKDYFIDEDLLVALQQAEEKFPDKLFYIVKVGSLLPPATNFVHQKTSYAWYF